jgi:hypothetical protein
MLAEIRGSDNTCLRIVHVTPEPNGDPPSITYFDGMRYIHTGSIAPNNNPVYRLKMWLRKGRTVAQAMELVYGSGGSATLEVRR